MKKPSLKEVYLSEEYVPDFNDLVDHMVDIFDEMMRGSISDQQYQKMIDDDVYQYVHGDEAAFKKILLAARKKVLKQTAEFLAREVQQQTE